MSEADEMYTISLEGKLATARARIETLDAENEELRHELAAPRIAAARNEPIIWESGPLLADMSVADVLLRCDAERDNLTGMLAELQEDNSRLETARDALVARVAELSKEIETWKYLARGF